MALPVMTEADILAAIPGVSDLGQPRKGGQKVVFPCKINGQPYALKFMLADPTQPTPPNDVTVSFAESFDEVTARARREVEIMGRCTTPHLVKLGPLPLTQADIAGQNVVYFTEEWLDGQDLRTSIKANGPLAVNDVVRMGKHIALAIDQLWSMQMIHRDIKPGNIMSRNGTGDFVLLDMGLALDLQGESLTAYGLVPGTQIYLSPDQMDYSRKRMLDFRSDLFSLGIVMYEALTGRHPFWSAGMNSVEAIAGILSAMPPRPSSIRKGVPGQLDEIILRLLAKKPHLRYRACVQLIEALSAVSV